MEKMSDLEATFALMTARNLSREITGKITRGFKLSLWRDLSRELEWSLCVTKFALLSVNSGSRPQLPRNYQPSSSIISRIISKGNFPWKVAGDICHLRKAVKNGWIGGALDQLPAILIKVEMFCATMVTLAFICRISWKETIDKM